MSTLTRRRFVQSFGAALTAAPAVIRARAAEPARLPIGFSTLGCPNWPLRTILDVAGREGYAAVELRGLEGEMDLPKRPEFSTGVAATAADLNARDLRVACLGSSAQLHHREPAERRRQLDEGRRFIDLAAKLQAPYVRVFGDKYLPDEPKTALVERVAAGLRELAAHAKGSGVEVIIESHGEVTDSATLKAILTAAGDGAALLWDAHHTVVASKEAPADTYRALGAWVRHTHLKDSRPEGADVRYVLTGTGTVPLREIVKVLAGAGYKGYYSFEWEKKWHPDIEEPEIAIPHYARVMREYLTAVGVKPS
jgi:sugar phosphate isomerase/epimerase